MNCREIFYYQIRKKRLLEKEEEEEEAVWRSLMTTWLTIILPGEGLEGLVLAQT